MKVWPGNPYPLGATFDGAGTNFSLFSHMAERVELCLFDEQGRETRVDLPESTGRCWHGYFPGIEPGQRYGFRVHGPWAPEQGHRCNPAKLLLDPYAKGIDGDIRWDEAVFPYPFNGDESAQNGADSAPFMPRCTVQQPFFDWAGDRQLRRPWNETIIYELHVKGFTAQHPDIPPELRGTYAGLAHPAVIAYLRQLGVTAVELMPVHYFVQDKRLVDQGLRNYWGYNSISYFAPHGGYAADKRPGAASAEFRQMVKTMHQAGMEVILDVVYNHTAEGNHLGPVLSFKGIDNAYYYQLMAGDRRYYMDYTGTGNSLNMRQPHVLQLIMDSLRYWVLEMHVDGFRFDLAATLARELHEVEMLSAFFDIIQQDPVISQVKLIAEPWDLGEGGYQVGNFPSGWSEWNGKYRDCLRNLWRGQEETLSEFAYRFAGSPDLYADNSRIPFASINFVTAHDGFTLRDLVSYNCKHNQANGEDNRDGSDDNRSWNCGVEGPTGDTEVLALRARQQRNFLVTLMLSQGVPMLLAGDEIGRTQQGNNNAYCQDNEISWLDWAHTDEDLLEFTQRLIAFRHTHPVFRRRRWFQSRAIHGADCSDIAWFSHTGEQASEEPWGGGLAKSLGIFINGETIPNPNARGEPVTDDSFYLIFNAHHEALDFILPATRWGPSWLRVLDTTQGWAEDAPPLQAGATLTVAPRSIVLLQRQG
ncbi:glycogen debranching enzyme [Nitrosospira lacus]|uniref:Glycogen debranching enzyme n=1 Tax=Nitrosospira lacus TaxID=1288494 RepID=A0A1W6SPR3_9PROT|nr:glycogen debranching protein GlgX [Nitrosospira lacus]ARO87783.1 glycogen debranching enzyme [Nitrosospira lacus]